MNKGSSFDETLELYSSITIVNNDGVMIFVMRLEGMKGLLPNLYTKRVSCDTIGFQLTFELWLQCADFMVLCLIIRYFQMTPLSGKVFIRDPITNLINAQLHFELPLLSQSHFWAAFSLFDNPQATEHTSEAYQIHDQIPRIPTSEDIAVSPD